VGLQEQVEGYTITYGGDRLNTVRLQERAATRGAVRKPVSVEGRRARTSGASDEKSSLRTFSRSLPCGIINRRES
jgi:hypothetical protein